MLGEESCELAQEKACSPGRYRGVIDVRQDIPTQDVKQQIRVEPVSCVVKGVARKGNSLVDRPAQVGRNVRRQPSAAVARAVAQSSPWMTAARWPSM